MSEGVVVLGDVLQCPCGGDYLHHSRVVVYSRVEDNEHVWLTIIGGHEEPDLELRRETSKESNNPSDRRDGLTIEFWCEQCDATHELTIAQHKGQSLIGWRRRPE